MTFYKYILVAIFFGTFSPAYPEYDHRFYNEMGKGSARKLVNNDNRRHKKKNRETGENHLMVDGCDSLIWKHVYDPQRLKVIEACKTVTGIITERNADPDGDEHMLLTLDKGQNHLLTAKNYKKKNGNLVIEAVCVNNITRKRAKGICKGYSNMVQLPKVGDHVRVTGSYVLDSHNGWTEIHPITKIEIIN